MSDKAPITLITGASDGIGLCLAKLYHRQGRKVVAAGRRLRAEISPPLPMEIPYVQADLAAQDGRKTLAAAVGDTPIDLLIQNAGVGWYGDISDQSLASVQTVVDINLSAPIQLSHAFTDNLKSANGQIVFIGSSAVKGATPLFATYTATKAALNGFARSLALEWEGQIKVQMINPCPTATDMHAKVGLPPLRIARFFPSTETVAKTIKRKIKRGKNYRFGLGFMLRHAPASWRNSA